MQAGVYPRPFPLATWHMGRYLLQEPHTLHCLLVQQGPVFPAWQGILAASMPHRQGVCFKGSLGHTVTSWVT